MSVLREDGQPSNGAGALAEMSEETYPMKGGGVTKLEGKSTLTSLPQWVQDAVAIIKEAGAIGLAILVVAFYLGQQAGWIPDTDRADHVELLSETKRQTSLINQNQDMLKRQVEQMQNTQQAIMSMARVVCYQATKGDPDKYAQCMNINGHN